MLLLLACSAAVSSSEVALFSFTPTQRKQIEEDDKGELQFIRKLTTLPDKESATHALLATILITNNAVNIAIVIISSQLMEAWFPIHQMNPVTAILIHIVLVTFVIVMFGEVVPKIFATSNNILVARWMSRPLLFLQRAFYPLTWFLIRAGSGLEKKLKRKVETISVNELGHALELTQDEMRSAEERRILEGIVTFGAKNASQIMTPRMDVAALNSKWNLQEVIQKIREKGYSRWPVYDTVIDQIVGVLHIKDLLPHMESPDAEWIHFVRPGKFVPENKMIDDLLIEFRKDRTHLALVVDEYGGLSGILTLEDVIEEIVGEIKDEFDEEDLKFSVIDELTYLFEGKISLVDFYRVMKLDGMAFDQAKGDSSTLGGFIMESLGRVPTKGEKWKFNEFEFTIEAGNNKKLDRIKVQWVK